MPILENPRHEAFARELAKGKSATEAYEIASQESRLTKPLKVSVSDLVVALRDGMFNVIDRYCFDVLQSSFKINGPIAPRSRRY